eukprot:2740654-Amphidinium_carterae.2
MQGETTQSDVRLLRPASQTINTSAREKLVAWSYFQLCNVVCFVGGVLYSALWNLACNAVSFRPRPKGLEIPLEHESGQWKFLPPFVNRVFSFPSGVD